MFIKAETRQNTLPKTNTRSYKFREFEKFQIFLSLNASLIHFMTTNDMASSTTWKQKSSSSPVTGLEWSRGFQEFKVPGFMITAQFGGKVVGLTHRPPLPPRNAPGTHFCQRLSRPLGYSAIGRILRQ